MRRGNCVKASTGRLEKRARVKESKRKERGEKRASGKIFCCAIQNVVVTTK